MLVINVKSQVEHLQTLHNALDLVSDHADTAHQDKLKGSKVEERILKQLLPILFNEYIQRLNNPEINR